MADPTLPQLTVDTTLQAAIDAVSLSTIISLTAGTEYSGSWDFGIQLKC